MSLAEARMRICKACPNFGPIMKTCSLCSCFMPAKTLIKSSSCPDNPPKWIAVNDPANNPECSGCKH
jgi:hypothetical protein